MLRSTSAVEIITCFKDPRRVQCYRNIEIDDKSLKDTLSELSCEYVLNLASYNVVETDSNEYSEEE